MVKICLQELLYNGNVGCLHLGNGFSSAVSCLEFRNVLYELRNSGINSIAYLFTFHLYRFN